MIGSFSLKKSAFPWGLLYAVAVLTLFAHINNRYPGAFIGSQALHIVEWQVFVSFTLFASCMATILSHQMSKVDQPPLLSMVSDGFRLAFVFCAPTLLMTTIFRGLFIEVGRNGDIRAGLSMGTAVIAAFLFSVLFHLSRKIFFWVFKVFGGNIFVNFAFALLLLGVSANRIHLLIDGAKATHERMAGRGPSIPPPDRTPLTDVYEGFNVAPEIIIEAGKSGFLFGGRFSSYTGKFIGPLVKVDGFGKLVEDYSMALGGAQVSALAYGPTGEIYGIKRVGLADNATLFKIDNKGKRDMNFSSNVEEIRLSVQGGRLGVFPDGRLLYMGGFKLRGEEKLLCLFPDGKTDKQFQSNLDSWVQPKEKTNRIFWSNILSSGKIMVLTNDGFYRLNFDGTPDSTFTSKQERSFHSFTFSSDEKYIAELTFLGVTQVEDVHVVITTMDGEIIADWLWAKQGGCMPLKAMSMGKNGFLYGACSNLQTPLSRLTLSGSTDSSFLPNNDPKAAIVGTINLVIPLSNGGCFLAGDVRVGDVQSGGRVGHLIRLMEDGKIDPTFWPS